MHPDTQATPRTWVQATPPDATAVPDPGDYVVPGTRRLLVRDGDTLLDPASGSRYPVRGGIPVFNRYPPAEDARTVTELDKLNDLATAVGWLEALRETYRSNPGLVRYVTDATRTKYLDLLPLTPTSRVLEIGPGLGQFTPLLAQRSRWVDALEIVEQQARFAQERCRQSGAANVSLACGGDDCRLPYSDRTFDIVVLNLVFEWCGAREPDTAEDSQRRLLAEIRRVLQPGGVLYLSTKNRYALRYLLGGRDEHMHNVRFGSALPRALGRWCLARRGKPTANGRLRSWGELRRMLRESGLEVTDSFWAAPEMRCPARLIKTDARSIRAARREGGFRQGDMRREAWAMRFTPAGLVKYVTPGLTFLARRAG